MLFLIYINDITKDLTTSAKLIPDDNSLFSVVHDTRTSTNDLNKDVEMINNWAFQWKMSFNLDPTKKTQEVISKEIYHPSLVFNNSIVSQSSPEKHLKLVSLKINKNLGLHRKLQTLLPRSALITI